MEYLQIRADISQRKLTEFNQSKHTFIDCLQSNEGYLGFTEKQGDKFHMQICWSNKKCLMHFLNTDQYKFFHGAIVTLSNSNSINVISEVQSKKIKT